MPVGLYEMYNQMMREILKQENNYPDYCKTVLLAAVNPYRPLQFTKWKTKKKLPNYPLWQCLRGSYSYVVYFPSVKIRSSTLSTNWWKTILFRTQSQSSCLNFVPNGQAEGHRLILPQSLSCMSKDLKRNIYALEYPGFPIFDVKLRSPDSLKRSDTLVNIGSINLVKSVKIGLTFPITVLLYGFIRAFFFFFFHWLEALSLMKSISIGVTATAKLASLITVSCLFLQKSPHRC